MIASNDEAAMLCRLARQDALAFAALVANPDIDLRIACFHGQQAVEKFLKAALVAQGLSFEPTHNLLKLSELLGSTGITLPVAIESLKRPNPYAVVFRYDDREINLLTREEADRIVGVVAHWAEALLDKPS